MKTRSGFVSNSSSSSFIVAVKIVESQDGSPTWFNILEFLIKKYGGRDELKSFSSKVGEQIKVWRKELKELKADKNWCLDQHKIYEDMLAVEVAIPLLAKLLRHDTERKQPQYDKETTAIHDKARIRCTREYGETEARQVLESAKERINYDIMRIDRDIAQLSKKIEKVKQYDSDEWYLLGFEEDNYSDPVAQGIKELEERGQAVIVERINH
jgi:hypothetical protein